MAHVVIIGSGIIGTLSAYYLAEYGIDVTVIERRDNVACEASDANGAQLSYNYVPPLGSPALPLILLSTIFQPTPAMRVDKWIDPHLWRWGLELLQNSRARRSIRNQAVLNALARQSRTLMQDFLEKVPLEFDYKVNGKLHVFDDPRKLESLSKRQKILSPDECLALEPFLQQRKGQMAGGIFWANDAVGDCHKFCEGLAQWLQKARNVHFMFNTEAKSFIIERGRIKAVKTNNNTISADHVLLCTGAAKMPGTPVNIYPVKGYSLTLQDTPQPQVNITDHARRMVFAPLGADRLRIASFMRFAGYDMNIHEEDIKVLKERSLEVRPDLPVNTARVLSGLRPFTPSSTPLLGKLHYDNLYTNLGHGMSGWTLAHATCKKIADLICDS